MTAFNELVVCPVLIGRTSELAALRLCVEQGKSGKGRVALLCGEAGIGKSRLVAELKTEAVAQGFQSLQGHCFPSDRSCPYAPLLDLLRSIFLHTPAAQLTIDVAPFARELMPLLPEVTQMFPDLAMLPPLPALEPEQEKRRLFAALARFFLTQAATRPLLLIVEDVHWSDESSLDFLHYLARHCAAQPLLVVLTYRSDELGPGLGRWLAELDRAHVTREIVLSRLTRSETATMLGAIFDLRQAWHAETLNTLYELTEGNPFFIEEILKSLVAVGEIVCSNGSWECKPLGTWHIPRSIQVAVKLRADQVSASARQVLLLAAVAGRRFDFAVLQQVTNHDEQQLLTLMKELIAAQLVVEVSGDHFAFRHALTRQAMYAQLLARERKALHRTIAETLEQLYLTSLDSYLADLGSHFAAAEDWEKALEYAQRAGEQAQRLYAPRVAIEQYSRAIHAAGHLARAMCYPLYRRRGQAYETLGEFERARSDYEQALQAAHDAADGAMEWQSVIDLGFLWAGRDYAQAGAWFHRAIELAERLGNTRLRAQSLNRLGNWLVNTGQVPEGLQAHEEALALFQMQQDTQGMAETLDLLAQASGMYGDSVNCAIQYGRAIDLFRTQGDHQGLVSSLTIRLCHTSPAVTETVFIVPWTPQECERDATEMLQLTRQMELAAGEALAEISSGLALASFGQFAVGLAHAQRGLQIATEIDHLQWIAGAHCYLGQIYVLMLEPTLALQQFEAGLPRAQALGSAWWSGHLVANQALAYLLKGEVMRAEEALRAVISREQRPGNLSERRMALAWAELALAQNEPTLALQLAEQLLQSAPGGTNATRTQPIPWLLKVKGQALLTLKRRNEAVQVLEDAKCGALERHERPLLWRIHGLLGRVYQSLRRSEEAWRAFAAARAVVAELAEGIDDPGLRAQFTETALSSLHQETALTARRAAAEKFGGLTAREREVVALIAQGKSNPAIADALVVTKRTIETHISNIMFKLGVTSRAQIAAWAAEKA
jgi:DNA-binding CsgD family transcriptional regulator